jgi:hypothetical protein
MTSKIDMYHGEVKFDSHDYAIGGKMVVGKAQMSDTFRMLLEDGDAEAKQAVKSNLIHQMAQFILENNLVEFTYYDNPVDQSRHVAVRAYLAPNDQIKILRVANKIV